MVQLKKAVSAKAEKERERREGESDNDFNKGIDYYFKYYLIIVNVLC